MLPKILGISLCGKARGPEGEGEAILLYEGGHKNFQWHLVPSVFEGGAEGKFQNRLSLTKICKKIYIDRHY